jgi:nucleoside-diphosphate-sugar epimerase
MIYITGANGLIGSRFLKIYDGEVTTISYRDEVPDVFDSHENSCLIHLAWSSTTRNTYDEFEKVIKNDVTNSKTLFDYYINKNPNGKIIFISSAGDLYLGHGRTACEKHDPSPHSLYGECKLHVENILKELSCKTVVLRTSNIWGAKVSNNRVNGLVDKLLNSLDTDKVIEIFADLKTRVDLIHIDDFVDLLIKVVNKDLQKQHESFLVGRQSVSICDIIDIVSKRGSLTLRINQKAEKTYLHIENSKVRTTFDWQPNHILK